MRLYFAFGSNMDRAHMARLCRGAEADNKKPRLFRPGFLLKALQPSVFRDDRAFAPRIAELVVQPESDDEDILELVGCEIIEG